MMALRVSISGYNRRTAPLTLDVIWLFEKGDQKFMPRCSVQKARRN